MTIIELLQFRSREPGYSTPEALVASLTCEGFKDEEVPEQCKDALKAFRKMRHVDRLKRACTALGVPLPVPGTTPIQVTPPPPVISAVTAGTIEERFRHARQTMSFEERAFVNNMRDAATSGVSFSLMLQVVEWEWQQRAPEAAQGPEHYRKLLKKQATEIERLKFRCGEL